MKRNEPKLRVLAVDDDKDFREMLRVCLASRCEVLCRGDGLAIEEDLDAFQPDLVILDVNMPEIGGFEVCRRVRAHPRHKDLPVIFLTGSKEDSDFVEHLSSRGSGYLAKPVNTRELLSMIKDMTARFPVRAMIPES